jgi:hypothetical protein
MNRMHRIANWIILILAVLCVPFTHGILEEVALILPAVLLIGVNTILARRGRGRVAQVTAAAPGSRRVFRR